MPAGKPTNHIAALATPSISDKIVAVMATRKGATQTPPVQIEKFASSAEIDRAIAKLKMRIDDVKALDPREIRFDDQRVYNETDAINYTLLEVFGPYSPEYERNQGFYFGRNASTVPSDDHGLQMHFAEGIPDAISLLEGLIKRLEEKRADFGDDVDSRVRDAFGQLDLHPRIAAVSAELFHDGHYRNAVLDASVALVNFVKEKSRRHDLDGAELMRTIFSKNNPVLMFNDLKDKSAQDEQEGLMHLFEGAVLALRNPRAHELSPDSPEAALEFIAFLSLLAKQVDRAERRKDP